MSWKLQQVSSGDAAAPRVNSTLNVSSSTSRAQAATHLLHRVIPPTLVLVTFLAIWQFAIPLGIIPGVPPQYLGSPSEVVARIGDLLANGYTNTPLWRHFFASLTRTLLGVGLATLVGVPAGLAIGLNKTLDRTFGPIIGFLRPIPALAFIPIVIIWLGVGEESKVFVIFMSSLMFMTTGAILGVQAVPNDYYLVARNYGLSRWRLLIDIVLPPALPQTLAGFRTALTIGWAVVVAAELIGASEGLGYMIQNASQG